MSLRLGPTMTLPDEAVARTFALLAMRGAGKSNGLVVMAEAMHKAHLPWVAIDAKGDWWGIRSSADGSKPGLSVPIFGGLRGDVPLEASAGHFVADLIVEQNITCLLDVSQFSKGDQLRFLTEFAERLYKRHQADPQPRHVFMEEAEEYLPQQVSTRTHGGYAARCVGAWSKLVKLGRAFGLGMTMATQRSASLNKDGLTQTESLIVLRTAAPQDIDQIKRWVENHSVSREIISSMPSLEDGEAWMVSPHFLRTVERFRFNRRTTFDSGATPVFGKKTLQPKTLSEIDLAAVKEAMAETIERVQADDPKTLRRRIRELEAEIAKSHVAAPVIEKVPTPVLTDEARRTIDDLRADLARHAEVHTRLAGDIINALDRVWDLPRDVEPPREIPTPVRTTPARRKPSAANTDNLRLGKTERNVLTVLIQHGAMNNDQIALLAGYSAKASTIGVALARLRKQGLVSAGQPVSATQAGIDALGDDVEQLPEGRELLQYWRNRFGATERNVLDALVQLWPNDATQAEVAELTGYSASASTIGVALSKLRKVGVVDRWRLSENFARATNLT